MEVKINQEEKAIKESNAATQESELEKVKEMIRSEKNEKTDTLVDALILGTKTGFPPPVLSPNQATEAITLIDTIAMAKNLVATIDLRDMIKEAIVKSIESKNFEVAKYLIRAIQEISQDISRQENLLKLSKEKNADERENC